MEWTEEELNTVGIMRRIDEEADHMADRLILEREGYQLPVRPSDWSSKQSKDYRHYFNIVKANIIGNMYPASNAGIKADYQEYLKIKEQKREAIIKEWEKSL